MRIDVSLCVFKFFKLHNLYDVFTCVIVYLCQISDLTTQLNFDIITICINMIFIFQTKDICHVWELGGGLVFKELLSVMVEKSRGRHLSVVLVLDLSKPEVLWNTLEILLEEVKTHLENVPEIDRRNQIDVQNVEVCFNLFTIKSLC